MKIRTRLSLTFVGVVAAILLLFSLVVYATAEYFRQRDFYSQLSDKAKNTARLLLDEDEIDPRMLRIIERNNLTALPEEQINVYDQNGGILYATRDSPIVKPDELLFIRKKKEVFFRKNRAEIVGFTYQHENRSTYWLLRPMTNMELRKLAICGPLWSWGWCAVWHWLGLWAGPTLVDRSGPFRRSCGRSIKLRLPG